jgi:IS30 family transposase
VMAARATQFEQRSAQVLDAVRAGASIEEAATAANVPGPTVRRWLSRGRKGDEPYRAWAAEVDSARGERKAAERAMRDGPLTVEEASMLLAKAARRGSVPALRLYFDQRAEEAAAERGEVARKLLREVFDE